MPQFLLEITGLVQGVSYRAYARRKAEDLGLSGYAKNLADGSVEVLLQGEQSKIETFIEWASQGPSSANVKKLRILKKENSPKAKIIGFQIL